MIRHTYNLYLHLRQVYITISINYILCVYYSKGKFSSIPLKLLITIILLIILYIELYAPKINFNASRLCATASLCSFNFVTFILFEMSKRHLLRAKMRSELHLNKAFLKSS